MKRAATLFTLVAVLSVVGRTANPADSMATAAERFLDTLPPDLRARAQLPFDSEDRTTWNYVPLERQGVALKMMNDGQRRAAMALLATGLSESGLKKAEVIRALEDVLREMEKGRIVRDPELYYVTIFGSPKSGAQWGWRYEGHHLSQHWTVVNGKAIATTPQFFGANPAEIKEGQMAGSRPLAREEDLAFALLHALDAGQQSRAIVELKAPRDILTTNMREALLDDDRGLPWKAMTSAQQKRLMALIEEHAGAHVSPLAQDRLARLRAAGVDSIRFAWMGAHERSEAGHYYRIKGPTFLIEFDNTQNRANHIHQVWRDFTGDFGRDLLAEHYRAAHR